MTSPATNGRAKPGGRVPILGLGTALLLALLPACPGTLPDAISKYDAGAVTGTGGSMGTGGSTGGCDVVAMVFNNGTPAACAATGCHNPVPTLTFSPDLSGTESAVWARLVGVNAITGVCAGTPLINPAKPADGALIKRMAGTSCGSMMPFPTTVVSQPALDCITSWANSKLP